MGDPGPRRSARDAAAQRVCVPRAPETRGRQLPLLGEVRHDTGLGDLAGPGRAGQKAVPVAVTEPDSPKANQIRAFLSDDPLFEPMNLVGLTPNQVQSFLMYSTRRPPET